MKAVVRTSTCPLHLEEPPRFITFPVLRMHLLIQIWLYHAAQVPESHCRPVHRCLTFSSSEEDDDTPADEIPSPDNTPPVQYHWNTFQQTSFKCTLNVCITLEEEEEEDFQTVPHDDEHWIWRKSLTEIYVSMNIHYHMDYVHIFIHIQITRHHHTITHWI